MIRPVTIHDSSAIVEIYNYYILHTFITFEEELLDVQEMFKRIKTITKHYPWVVYLENDEILGYAYAKQFRTRSAYSHTVESSIYLKPNIVHQGIGSKLYQELIYLLQEMDFHAVISRISVPNDESISFHKKFGFKESGVLKEVGFKFNRWIDVAYLQLIL